MDLAEHLVGFTFRRVEYLIPSTMRDEPPVSGDGFEHAEGGVRLVGDSDCWTLRWAQAGFEEQLWIGKDDSEAEPQLWAPNTATREATWPGVNPKRILRATVGWQDLGRSGSTPWTVRLDLEQQSVVVCLGERDYATGHPTYIPDCVLVIFSDEVARRYRPATSSVNALAEPAATE